MNNDFYENIEIYKIHANFCKMFSNEKRLQILWKVSEKERSVSELAKELGLSIPNVSQHLRIMREKGAVTERKAGKMVYYRVSNEKIIKGYKLIKEALIEIQQLKAKILA